jgi:hypothetical protein
MKSVGVEGKEFDRKIFDRKMRATGASDSWG